MCGGCGANMQTHVMFSPPLAPCLHPLACFLIDLEHYFSLHHDDETFHNPQWKLQVEDTNCG
jgi:hypothetical protein